MYRWFLGAPCCVLAIAFWHSTLCAAELIGLGDLPGGDFMSLAAQVSGDGSTVVGQSSSAASGGRLASFRWTRETGMLSLGDLPGGEVGGAGLGVSYDGSVVVGIGRSSNGWGEAFRWTSDTGIVGVGDLPGGVVASGFRSASADGSVAVGFGYASEGIDEAQATRWSAATGLVSLGDFPGGRLHSSSMDVSADGQVIVGYGYKTTQAHEAFIWTEATGLVGLGDYPVDPIETSVGSFAYGVSPDGTVVVGQGSAPDGLFKAFRWTQATGMTPLGDFQNCNSSVAYAASNEGQVIVGQSCGGFIWTEATGMRRLEDVLTNLGVNLNGWNLYSPRDVSWDGKVIVGWGNNPQGETEAFMAIIPEPSTLALAAIAIAGLVARGRRRWFSIPQHFQTGAGADNVLTGGPDHECFEAGCEDVGCEVAVA